MFVITGTTSGIGKQMAKELAKRKGKVFMACRDLRYTYTVRLKCNFKSMITCKGFGL